MGKVFGEGWWAEAIVIASVIGPLWVLIVCRALFECLRLQQLLLGEKFGPYDLYNTKASTDSDNDD